MDDVRKHGIFWHIFRPTLPWGEWCIVVHSGATGPKGLAQCQTPTILHGWVVEDLPGLARFFARHLKRGSTVMDL